MKKLLAIVLAVCMVFCFAACGEKTPAKEDVKDVYPSKTITCIVPWAAGGSSDVSMRLVASVISEYLGQGMVIDNQPGGSAIPGTQAQADAAADGYTLGMNTNASFILRPLVADVTYKMDDFTFICAFASQRNVIAVPKDSPFNTIKDLIDYAKANPGKLKFAGSTVASGQHLIGAYLGQEAGCEFTHYPTSGGSESVTVLLGHNADFAIIQAGEGLSSYQSGDIRYLCLMDETRSTTVPDVPTIGEEIPELAKIYIPYTSVIVAPKGLPEEVKTKLQDAFQKIMSDEAFLKLCANNGIEPQYQDGAEWLADQQRLYSVFEKLVPAITSK